MEIRTLTGRRRTLAPADYDTVRLNTPVQGTGADGLKQALALLWERREACPGAVPVIACHDEIVVECDAGQADAAVAWVKQAMVDGMQALVAPVPVEVEPGVGPRWEK
jgi:DNA polymerase-1